MKERGQTPAVGGEVALLPDAMPLPAVLERAGAAARFAFEEFLHGQIRNPHTRKAYLHAVRQFCDWCEASGLDVAQVTPAHVGRYLERLTVGAPTRKLHLAALRRLFDALVLRHVVILNPALSVRGERYQVIEGKTPEISVTDARQTGDEASGWRYCFNVFRQLPGNGRVSQLFQPADLRDWVKLTQVLAAVLADDGCLSRKDRRLMRRLAVELDEVNQSLGPSDALSESHAPAPANQQTWNGKHGNATNS